MTDPDGVVRLNPEHRQMARALEDLYQREGDVFEDLVLTHDSGMAISLYPNGCAVLEHEEQRKLLKSLSREEQLSLFIQLAAGRLETIRKMDWQTE